MIDLPFNFSSNPGRHPHAGVARLINCYASDAGQGQRAKLPIYAREGQPDFATHIGAGTTRCMLAVETSLYVVNNRVLSWFDTAGTQNVIGGIASDGMVTAARNRRSPQPQIGFVCDGLFYLVTNNVISQVTDPDLPPPIAICFLAGYFILPIADGRFFWTSIDDGAAVEALDFASAEANPDGLVNAKVRGEDLVLIGSRSTEFHRLTSDVDNPFARSTSKNFGCLAPRSVCEVSVISPQSVSDTLGWVATDRQGRYAGVIMLDGYEARKISTEALDEIIRDEPEQALITATSWTSAGHGFFSISGTDWTWVFDSSTGLWHERDSYGSTRWNVVEVVDFAGSLVAGCRDAGKLVRLDHSALSDGVDPIIMTLQSSPVQAFPDRLDCKTLYVDVATGVGRTGLEDDPQIIMQWSEDGETWSTERWRSLGAEAQTGRLVSWSRLGTTGHAGRAFRLKSSANAVRGFYGARLDAEKVSA